VTELIPAWENGILKPVEKLKVHKDALKHMAVSVFIFVGGETLLQQRSLKKYHTPGLWANACCTHPYWKEKSKACALRRVYQELGISQIAVKFQDQIEYQADVGGGLFEHEVVDIFVSRQSSKDCIQLNLNTNEVMNTRWINLEKLKHEINQNSSIFTPWLKIYINDYIDRIITN